MFLINILLIQWKVLFIQICTTVTDNQYVDRLTLINYSTCFKFRTVTPDDVLKLEAVNTVVKVNSIWLLLSLLPLSSRLLINTILVVFQRVFSKAAKTFSQIM